jgi:exocyst complex component 3
MNDVESVTVKLAELLRHPEDLDKIAGLKSDFTRKKAAVDSQLRIGLQEQLAVTQSGMSSILTGQQTVELIKAEMQKIDKLCMEAQNMIKDFPHINLVAQTHRNFSLVETMKNDIEQFDSKIYDLKRMLKEDDADLENQHNLLHIHYELTKLRDIRDSALGQAKSSGEAVEELINNLHLASGPTLQEYFGQLDDVVEWFDDHVGTACMNLIPLIQQGSDGLITRLAIVVHEEEKSDKKAKALQDAQLEYRELASRFKSIAAGQKEIRGYKEKFLQAIELYAEAQYEGTTEAFESDPDTLDKSMRWYFNDLMAVKNGLVNLMPKKWKIFETYVRIYHKQLHDWLVARIDDPATPPPQLLAIVNWEEKYYKKMGKLGASELWLRPHLIDGRAGDVIREYRQLIIKTVDDWMGRMGTTDSKSFTTRDEAALDQDENGCMRTKTMSDMWRMLREQLEVAKACDRTDIVEGVVEAMFRALQNRQRMWEQLIDAELQKYSDPMATSEGYQPLQDWLIAIANDQIACIDDGDETSEAESISYLTRFSRDIQGLVSPDYISTVLTQTESLKDGYVDLSTHCLAVFARLILVVDFRPLLPEFFTPAWYGKKGMGQAISTFEDYLTDYAPVLHPSLTDILAEELADELLIKYLSCVRNKSVKFRRSDPFVEKIKDDVTTVFNFFGKFDTIEGIKLKWRVIEWLVNFLEAPKESVPDVYEEFKQGYWDAGMGWVEACLRARDDFDRGMLNAVKARAAQVEVGRGVETIMGKVK